MNVIAWNWQGMRSPGKIQFLKEVTRMEKVSFVFLCVTINNYKKMADLYSSLGFEGFIVVEPQGRTGGNSLFWKNFVSVSLSSYSRSQIDIVVSLIGKDD